MLSLKREIMLFHDISIYFVHTNEIKTVGKP